MASAGDDQDGPNVDVNIVPFIDLMSVMITFLLITAVWTQVSMIQIGTSIYGKSTPDVSPKPEPTDIELQLAVVESGFRVRWGASTTPFPKIKGEYDRKGITDFLKAKKLRNQKKDDAKIEVSEALEFEDFILGMDILIDTGFTNVTVMTGEVN